MAMTKGALVLTRKEGQPVVIELPNGERIVITPGTFKKGSVRLMFKAPSDCKIWRGELLAREEAVHAD